MNEKRDILVNIENHNEEVPLDYHFEKLPFFFITPQQSLLLPNQSSSFTVSFLPKSLGDFSNTLILSFLNGAYTVPLRLRAISASISLKTIKTRGPEGLLDDFEESKNFIIEGTRSIKTRKGENRLIFSSQESLKPKDFLLDSLKTNEFLKNFSNKQKYDRFLKDTRIDRLKLKEKCYIAKIAEDLHLKTELKSPILVTKDEKGNNSSINENQKASQPPLDLNWALGLYNREKLPKLTLPKKNDPLFVKKPIDKYEPIVVINAI